MAPDHSGGLTVTAEPLDPHVLLTASGMLDSSTYHDMRDRIVKAALDEPRAVLIDVAHLDVPAESAWAVFTSARWLVNRWPEVPIALVCATATGRSAIRRNGITRYVPVYPTLRDAIDALAHVSPPRHRRRARTGLAAGTPSLAQSRDMVAWWLTQWSHEDLIPVVKVIVTTLVENVLMHTDSAPDLRLESNGATVTVAVSDTSHRPAAVREDVGTQRPCGLQVLSALCRMWGNAPTASGKTIWVVVGPENRL